ncbi:MAG: purine-binding chemotaxis protein CheW [Lachnospiraceae bacterium]|nr:purine-binding chemotaxis protein CheW [Lachnospiraceae bacterium]
MDEIALVKETTQYIKVKMGDEMFGVDIKYIDNIVRMQSITRVPKVPAYIKGVINLRGEVIPVFNLRLKMGMEEVEETKKFRIIILKLDGNYVGLIVDEVREVITLQNDLVEKVYRDPSDPTQNFLLGVGKDGDNLISLLDVNEVVAEKN